MVINIGTSLVHGDNSNNTLKQYVYWIGEIKMHSSSWLKISWNVDIMWWILKRNLYVIIRIQHIIYMYIALNPCCRYDTENWNNYVWK